MSDILSKMYHHWMGFKNREPNNEYYGIYRKGKRDEFRKFVHGYIPLRGMFKDMVTVNVGGGPIPLKFYSKEEILVDPLITNLKLNFPEKYLKGVRTLNECIEETSIKSNHAHLIYCKKTIEYIEEWKKAISEMHRILKNKGYLVLIYHSSQGDNTNLNMLRNVDMKEHLESVGFTVLKFERESSSYTKILARKI